MLFVSVCSAAEYLLHLSELDLISTYNIDLACKLFLFSFISLLLIPETFIR